MIRVIAILTLISAPLVFSGCQSQKTEKSTTATNNKSVAKNPSANNKKKPSEPSSSTQKKKSGHVSKKQSVQKREFKNTGLQRDEVLKVLNDNSKGDGKFKHNFVLIKEDDESALYGDQHSETKLQFVGPKDDLLVVEFAMAMDSFVSGGGDSAIDQGGALANCINRLSGHLNPDQPERIYTWMKKNVKRAVFTADGAEMKYQHLLIIFDSAVSPKGTKTINFAVALPE